MSSTTGGTAVRPAWHELPEELRDGLGHLLGDIVSAHVQTGGFTPGLAVRLTTRTSERVFVKGIPTGHILAVRYRTEAQVAHALPARAPAPRLRWYGQLAGWEVLAFDDLDGHHPELSPHSPDIPRVVETVASLAEALTPCPLPDAPPAASELGGFVHGWRALAAAPPADLDAWPRENLNRLADLETHWLDAADGDTLLHGDVNRANLLINPAGVWLVDWAQPVRGAPWIDVADLVPHLILAGHTPADAEQVLVSVPTWRDTDPDTLTSYAVAFAGYWTRMSRSPAPPGVPNLRPYQARAAHAAIRWTAHRTAWT
ncbi:hypothetical protein [Streptosporangium saharense]|uniref:hypothetical protein n=1 Tax=Streptosporangium saharense TaxID=1706840 RepID=UPI003416FF17